ncbi:GAF domain-containing protein [Thiocystis violascens]|uniref:Bacteriophytochrome (Light-regulated signal transduction histidine kinase) n=1 Tax=Thiocystis violascens (strain ATCC 17096 / DSM 198 / 6111) TaxID=765911 RepID=I3YBF7_THIV6|nr:GAF domain-containing protein [Thiocystis violascens]AFL74325.1 bacteriophytochrome (light-regulated signal transduction histidine kinase) [Thiocystis violascens DSM 198]
MTESTLEPLLNECEQEPLDHSGLIQDGGVLLHIERDSGLIAFVSNNAAAFLGDAASDLIGTDGRAWIQDFLPDVSDLPTGAGRRLLLERALDLGFGELDVLVSATATGWLIELEPALDPLVDLSRIALRAMPEPIDDAALTAAQQDLVDRIAEATGFERVMLYEFKADWSGEVLAERALRSTTAYLGLRFPASDIPAIARALYARTPYRHIPDVNREPIAILSATGPSGALDLTWSDLRSVSPVHREYLRNMQVAASFSVSVIVEGRLWGLVACHHPEALRVPIATRMRCQELVAQHVALLTAHRRQLQGAQLARLERELASVARISETDTAVLERLQDRLAPIARLLEAEGVALVVDDEIVQSSVTDSVELIRALHDWCVTHQSEKVAAVERLPDALRFVSQASNGRLCGMLAVSVRAKRHGNRLVGVYFFRPAESMEIAWAGNPEKPVEVAGGASGSTLKLSPRHSFEKWVEVRTGFARPWDRLAMFTATQLQRRLEAML